MFSYANGKKENLKAHIQAFVKKCFPSALVTDCRQAKRNNDTLISIDSIVFTETSEMSEYTQLIDKSRQLSDAPIINTNEILTSFLYRKLRRD